MLLINGELDPVTPPDFGRRAQAAIPNARLVAIDNAGHLPQVEAFDRYWRAVEEFLGGGR